MSLIGEIEPGAAGPLFDLGDYAGQVPRLGRSRQLGMIGPLPMLLQNTKLPARVVGRVEVHGSERLVIDVLRARAGDQNPVPPEQPHGPQVDFLVTTE